MHARSQGNTVNLGFSHKESSEKETQYDDCGMDYNSKSTADSNTHRRISNDKTRIGSSNNNLSANAKTWNFSKRGSWTKETIKATNKDATNVTVCYFNNPTLQNRNNWSCDHRTSREQKSKCNNFKNINSSQNLCFGDLLFHEDSVTMIFAETKILKCVM